MKRRQEICFRVSERLDRESPAVIYARMPKEIRGVGLAVANRLLKAAGFNVIEV